MTERPRLTIAELVENTAELPSFSTAVFAVMKETDSSTGSAQSVARYISQDPALASRMLRLANSAYYSLSRQVMGVPDAVVVLGMRAVRNLAIIAGTYPWLSKELKGYRQGPGELWAHSFATAVASQVVARHCNVPQEQAFAAGLLHNLGKVALSIWLEHQADALVSEGWDHDHAFDEIEKEILGFNHAEVGAHLAEAWNLPSPMIRAIRWHHEPESCDRNEPLVDIVHLADHMAMSEGLSRGIDGLRYRISVGAIRRLGIDESVFDTMLSEFLDEYARSERLFEERRAA